MKDIWKWVILIAILAVLGLFTVVAFSSSATAGWIMVGADALVVAGLIYMGLKK